MFKEKWFKFLSISIASFFLFLAACLIIALLGPPPSEGQLHLWMSAMMRAMENSMMGFSMQLEEGGLLADVMYKSGKLILPSIAGGALLGFLTRFSQKR